MKMEKIKLVYQGAFAIPDAEEACVVTLTDTQEVRALSIVTDKPMANEIKFHQLDKDVKHPHLVDVLAKMICEQGPQNYHVVFEANGKIGPKAKLVNVITSTEYSLPQDEAVLLAVAAGLEIFTNMEVLQNFSTPFSKNVMSVALPIVGLPDSLLKKALEKAVEEENYEGASFIRDEMKRRQEEKDEKDLTDR